jgi:hypothetical protein
MCSFVLRSMSSTELRAIWSVLAAIYHLGVAGVTQYTMGRAGFAKSQVHSTVISPLFIAKVVLLSVSFHCR